MDSIENRLKAILFRKDCPAKMDLGEYELGLLSSQRRKELAAHLAVCPHCPADLVQIRQFMALPAMGIEAVKREVKQKAPLFKRIKVIIVDLLSPPTAMMRPVTVLRGAENNMRTRVIQADDYIISISALEDNTSLPKHQILGDIIPLSGNNESFQNWTASLYRSGALLTSTPVADDAHFIFEDVQLMEKPHELILNGPTIEIHLQNLQIA